MNTQLSRAQRQVLLGIAQGVRLKHIAKEMEVTQGTVNSYRRRVLEKLGLETDAQLAVYAHVQGLTKWPFENPPPKVQP